MLKKIIHVIVLLLKNCFFSLDVTFDEENVSYPKNQGSDNATPEQDSLWSIIDIVRSTPVENNI